MLFRLPCSDDVKMEHQLLSDLANMLKVTTSVPKWYTLYIDYCGKHPYLINRCTFILIDNIPFCFDPYTNEITSMPSIIQADDPRKFCLLHNFPDIALIKKALKASYPMIRAAKASHSILCIVYSKPANPFHMYIKQNTGYYDLYYEKNERKFQTKLCTYAYSFQTISSFETKLVNLSEELDISNLFHNVLHTNDDYIHLRPTEEIAKFLSLLTGNNLHILAQFAVLFANIASAEYITPKIFLFTGVPEDTSCSIADNFQALFDRIFSCVTPSLRYKTLKQLLQ